LELDSFFKYNNFNRLVLESLNDLFQTGHIQPHTLIKSLFLHTQILKNKIILFNFRFYKLIFSRGIYWQNQSWM